MQRVFLLGVAATLIEVALLAFLGSQTSVLFVLGLVLLSIVGGASLLRRAGRRAPLAIRQSIARGEMPTGAVLDQVGMVFAACLFIMPGVVSDALGLLLLIRPLRQLAVVGVAAWFFGRLRARGASFSASVVGAEFDEASPIQSFTHILEDSGGGAQRALDREDSIDVASRPLDSNH